MRAFSQALDLLQDAACMEEGKLCAFDEKHKNTLYQITFSIALSIFAKFKRSYQLWANVFLGDRPYLLKTMVSEIFLNVSSFYAPILACLRQLTKEGSIDIWTA